MVATNNVHKYHARANSKTAGTNIVLPKVTHKKRTSIATKGRNSSIRLANSMIPTEIEVLKVPSCSHALGTLCIKKLWAAARLATNINTMPPMAFIDVNTLS